MRKWLVMVAALIGLWLLANQQVHAAGEADPNYPGYDPAQGGLVFDPPDEIWVQTNQTTEIPFTYAAHGFLGGSITASFQVQINSTFQTLTSNSWIYFGQFGQVRRLASNYSFMLLSTRTDEADLTIKLTTSGGISIIRTIRVHFVSVLPQRLVANVAQQYYLAAYPINVYWLDDGQRRYAINMSNQVLPGTDTNIWNRNAGVYFKTPGISFQDQTVSTAAARLISATIPVQSNIPSATIATTAYIGIPPMIGREGQAMPLGAWYYQPRSGTKLTFKWTFTGAAASVVTSDQPFVPADKLPHFNGKVYVELTYTDTANNYSATIRSEDVNYQFIAAPRSLRHIAVKDLIQGDVRVPATLPALAVTGQQYLDVTMTPLLSANGTHLDAALVLSNGEQVTPTHAVRILLNGAQIPQAEWLFHRQVNVLAGAYEGTILFTLISGP
ncbi:hypothetical protein [Lacticaseibacillus jixiensis]|uniref:hypothetical protein n=1 Tax=Lacticaseibacillus jixiensis TaxID=3231926 RepID=UPI0036F21597